MNVSASAVDTRAEWGSDFFGTLNEMPTEPVGAISGVLEEMSTLPAFRDGRRWMLSNLDLAQGSSVVEGSCGDGAALEEIRSAVGPEGRIVGIDPTEAFIEPARSRAAELGVAKAKYEIGDIRALSFEERPPRCLHHFVGYPAKEEGIGPCEILGGVTMQVFVRGYCTMMAAPVQCDVDGIPKGSHCVGVPRSRLYWELSGPHHNYGIEIIRFIDTCPSAAA